MPKWETQSDPIRQPFRIGIHGKEFSGKTFHALTAPRDPVAYFHNNERLYGTLDHPRFASRDIRRFDYGEGIRGKNPEEVQDIARERVRELQEVAYEASSWANTIILDTDTDAWLVYRFAYFAGEKPSKSGRRDAIWAEINGAWRMLFNTMLSKGADLIVVSADKPVYVDHKETDQIVAKCSSIIPRLCDVRLETRVDNSAAGASFVAKVIKPGLDVRRIGEEFYDSDLPTIMESLYGRNVWEVNSD